MARQNFFGQLPTMARAALPPPFREGGILAATLLEDEGVALIGGPDFGILGEGYIRVSYANSAENIKRAMTRFADFLARKHNTAAVQ